jgi:hypothetical protein
MKCWGAFGRLQHAEPAAGTGTYEDEPPALAQRARDQARGARNLRQLARNGSDGAGILSVHQAKQLERGEAIEVAAAGIASLSRQVLVANRRGHDEGSITCAMGLRNPRY